MADSAVAITAGSGTNVDTRTEATNGNHRQVVVLGDPSTNAGVAPVDATNGLAVDVKAIVPGTGASNLGKADGATFGDGDTGVLALGVRNTAQTTFSGSSGLVTPIALDGAGNVMGIGNIAHDGVDAGNPLKIGAQARQTNPTAVADADRSNLITDDLGKLIVAGSIRDLKGNQKTTITSSTSETTIVTAVASTFLDLYGLVIANTSASACNVTIKDATSGTTRFIFAVPAGETRGFMIPESGAHLQASVNNNWTATCSASVASIEITAMFVKNI